jgi:ribonuclease HII
MVHALQFRFNQSMEDATATATVNHGKKNRKIRQEILKGCYFDDAGSGVGAEDSFLEIGVDEAGRGPMFGRVYVSAVVLPHPQDAATQFDFSKMKDSKKFHSEKKIKEVAEYIKTHAISWSVKYAEHDTIDTLNIRRATIQTMHDAIREVCNDIKDHSKNKNGEGYYLLIDGNDFIPMLHPHPPQHQNQHVKSPSPIHLPYSTIEGGDNTYASIAAASILAKVSRDEYIMELCKEHPELQEKYDLENNKGYGTKKHMDGIKQYGISEWHRKSFGICKNY